MKNKILCLTMMLLTIMCSCGQQSAKKEHTNGKDSITISYQLLKNDSPMVKEYASQEPQYAFNVTLQGNMKDTPYKLYQIHVKEGNVERTEIVQEKPCTADSIQHFFFASIMEGKENVRIICNHQVNITVNAIVVVRYSNLLLRNKSTALKTLIAVNSIFKLLYIINRLFFISNNNSIIPVKLTILQINDIVY